MRRHMGLDQPCFIALPLSQVCLLPRKANGDQWPNKREREKMSLRYTHLLVSSECPSLDLLAVSIRVEILQKDLFLLSPAKSWSYPPGKGQKAVCR